MIRTLATVVISVFLSVSAWASNVCSGRSISSAADVTVSDGTQFRTESYFQSADTAAIRHIDDADQIVAVEGPLAWTSRDGRAKLGPDFYKIFALGHQYHALLLHFDTIANDVRSNAAIEFAGGTHRGKSGGYPYGGAMHLVDGEDSQRPSALVFEFPETPAIVAAFSDWRKSGSVELPYRIQIDDGENVFEYHYTDIAVDSKSPLWFFETVAVPPIDEIEIYRLYRTFLAAHCLGNPDLIAKLAAADFISASRGELRRFSNNDLSELFEGIFERFDYVELYEAVEPVIDISQSSDLGTISASERAIGKDAQTGSPFEFQTARIMKVRKIDGVWKLAAHASNSAE